MILVDTSVLVDFFRGAASEETARLERMERDGTPIAIPGFCIQELLQGARDQQEWDLLLEYLGSQEIVLPADPMATHIEAARIHYDLRRAGLTVRSAVDCWIAQLALETGADLLHSDRDFEVIARVRPLRFVV